MFHFDAGCKVHYMNPEASIGRLPSDQKLIFETALLQTASLIKEHHSDFFKSLVFRRIQMRISDGFVGTAGLLPHDIALNAALLRPDRKTPDALASLSGPGSWNASSIINAIPNCT